ncbi:NAD-dependent epimerase/dehydratase family protein [Alphaproteobacteria bacterium]|nr:NAD-dependent epimerase/dehydratase family protein [Alphaproteobacteria bacterium]
MNVLITGASGFLGKRLIEKISTDPTLSLTGSTRRNNKLSSVSSLVFGNLDSNFDWSHILKNQEVVIHAAGKAHIMDNKTVTSYNEYKKVNLDGTLRLAQQASISGVKRFIFISTIKVNGEKTKKNKPFTELDKPNPVDGYSLSKWEAEKKLIEISTKSGMEFVIIRPSLIYGPGVKGNFGKIISLIKRGLPLPLGAINNKRSFIAIDNLIDLITVCIKHPKASNQLFLAADGKDLSTSQLIKELAMSANKNLFLIPIPVIFLKFIASILRKKTVIDRLNESLQVDISKSKNLLNWTPPISIEKGLFLCF